MLKLAVFALLAAIGGSTTIQPSNVSFREALAACPGALGTVSFAMHFARVTTAEGAFFTESEPVNGAFDATLENESGSKSARVSIDQPRRSIKAKNVELKRNGTVACILPD